MFYFSHGKLYGYVTSEMIVKVLSKKAESSTALLQR